MQTDSGQQVKCMVVKDSYHFDVSNLKGELRKHEPMSRHTSWKTGGLADYYFIPADLNDLCKLFKQLSAAIPIFFVGKGSNLLVRDGGIRGIVISVEGILNSFTTIRENKIEVGAGLACVKAARQSANLGLSGIEFLAGIPGTVGGALAMNAGAWGGETWVNVAQVKIINRQGEIKTYNKSEFEIGYRSVSLADNEWFISAQFELQSSDKNEILSRIRSMLDERAIAQPLGQLSCGSVFRNPADDYAARLIEAAGLKGKSIGGASVSDKHANFIINADKASSADIEKLINHVAQVIKDEYKVELIPEVRIIGEPEFGGPK
ncbi:MAG: UDP-N-acetylmuramate dehydrogenase [Pseudomonadota bacterium]